MERRDDILRQAAADAVAELRGDQGDDPAEWRWGRMHLLTVRNQTFGKSGIGPIEWLFNRGPVALGPEYLLQRGACKHGVHGESVMWLAPRASRSARASIPLTSHSWPLARAVA